MSLFTAQFQTEPVAKLARLKIARSALARLFRDKSGQDLIEFALIAAVLALGAISGVARLSNHVSRAFENVSKSVSKDYQHESGGRGHR